MTVPLAIALLVATKTPAAGEDGKTDCRFFSSCIVEWNTGNSYMSACDLISRGDAEKALGRPPEQPIELNVPILVDRKIACEVYSDGSSLRLEIDYPQLSYTATQLSFSAAEFKREASRFGMTARDVIMREGRAVWAVSHATKEPYGELHVFRSDAIVSVFMDGVEDGNMGLESAKLIASSTLAKLKR